MRLTLWYAIAATVTAAIFMGIGRGFVERSYIDGVDLMNDKEFEEIRPRIESKDTANNKQALIDAILHHTEIDASLFFFQVGTSDDNPFFISSNLAGHYLPEEVHTHAHITVDDDELGLLRVAEYKASGFDIHIASSLENFRALESNLARLAVLILIAVFLTSLAVGYFMSRVALKPIETIRRTAAQITVKNLSQRIDIPDTGDEVAELAGFLNQMFDRLEASFNQVQQFTADASHELKTPLSLIRLNAESLSKSDCGSNPETTQLVTNQLDLIDQLNRIINDLLVLAKADAGVLNLSYAKVPLHQFIEDFAEDARALCEDKGIQFQNDNFANSTANIDLTWIRHLLFNLFSNAIKHSSPNSTITLATRNDSSHWTVSLTDEGTGIPEEQIGKVFDRFFTSSYQPENKGAGLGLALCKSIVNQHSGTISIRNRNESSGIVVEFSIPFN